MMIITRLLIAAFLLPIGFVPMDAQPETIYKDLQKKKFYAVNLSSTPNIGYYEVNGQRISKEEYDKFEKGWGEIDSCCPCIIERYDMYDKLMSVGISCGDCGVGWFKTFGPNGRLKITGKHKENPTGNWKDIYSRAYCSVPDGKWTFYDQNGQAKYVELWEDGQFLKQIPPQPKAEIWKIDVTLNDIPYIDQSIDLKEVGALKIIPRYKTDQIDHDLIKINFEASATGYPFKKKSYTLDSFKSINVAQILEEIGIPKEADTIFVLYIYAEDKLLKYVKLNLVR